jgi:putative ABC transport system ATP-binding protein
VARLSLREVRVRAGDRDLLAGLTEEIGPGEIVAVTGPSGSGKTTLLRALAGLIDPADGEVTLDGSDAHELGFPRWRRRVTYVAQEPFLFSGTVRENLVRPFSYAAVGGAFPEARARALLERLGLGGDDRLEQAAPTLSVGERQRVALVRALVIEPDVLLLDEPTSALDAGSIAEVEAVLGEWLGERDGRAALVVTHHEEQARRLCHRQIDLARYRVEAGVA